MKDTVLLVVDVQTWLVQQHCAPGRAWYTWVCPLACIQPSPECSLLPFGNCYPKTPREI